MLSQNVPHGFIGIYQGKRLTAGLQTCCSLTYFDSRENLGVAHAIVPSRFQRLYELSEPDSRKRIITPQQGAEALLEELIERGANRSELMAVILGGSISDSVAVSNFVEAMKATGALGIPIVFNGWGRSDLLQLSVTPESIVTTQFDSQHQEQTYLGKTYYLKQT